LSLLLPLSASVRWHYFFVVVVVDDIKAHEAPESSQGDESFLEYNPNTPR
jgi:hypothetical protein